MPTMWWQGLSVVRTMQNSIAELTAKGYKAKSIEKNKYGLYPVIYGSYATHEEAQEAVNKIRQQENNEAWLLIKE